MPHALMIDWFCRFYVLLLYAYPRPFRQQYGREMRQVFRDRCRYLARTGGRLRILRFALQSVGDWLTSILRERTDRFSWSCVFRATARHANAVWQAGRKQATRGFVAEWAMTILTLLFVTSTLMQAYVVPTGSMEGNLRVGDHLLVDRVAYAKPGAFGSRLLPYRDVERGDIVVFLFPEDVRQTYIKRVVGLPGDRIRLVDKQVVRNGRLLVEPYTTHSDTYRDPYRDDFPTMPLSMTTPRGRDMFDKHVKDGVVTVPPDALFVMGDNRENSSDSRYWGFVPRDYVLGKPLFVYWSYDAPTGDLEQWSLRHVLDVASHFFTRTRWERTLLVPRRQSAQEGGGAQ